MEAVYPADAVQYFDFGCRVDTNEQVTMQVKRPKLTIWERTYLPQIIHGLWLTLKHIPQRKFTRQYPEEKPPLYGAYRGAPTLVKDPEGRIKCVSCQLCEFVCPPTAIRITPGTRPDHAPDPNVEKQPTQLSIA